jgi:hypothetical protein
VARFGTQRICAFLKTFGVVVTVSVPRLTRRLAAVVLALLLLWMLVLAYGGAAHAEVTARNAVVAAVACGQQADAAACDADGSLSSRLCK